MEKTGKKTGWEFRVRRGLYDPPTQRSGESEVFYGPSEIPGSKSDSRSAISSRAYSGRSSSCRSGTFADETSSTGAATPGRREGEPPKVERSRRAE